jgi:AcrR family transcriptional regulator
MVKKMDRRQRKTREGIFKAFIELLSKKHFNQITVGEIIERADIGRATFYAHFETKDFLLKELCEELFCHLFDCIEAGREHHRHIFDCEAPSSVVLHLLQHLQKNDNNILDLLASDEDGVFGGYFKENLKNLIQAQMQYFDSPKAKELPPSYWIDYVATTFLETVRWWVSGGRKDSPEVLAAYFLTAIS